MIDKDTKLKPGKISGVKGMNDLLPAESIAVEWLEGKVRHLMARFAYRNIRTPIVEHTPLYIRSLGEVTDIVEKEMYNFQDQLNGDLLTLRPEGTAGVVRAAIEHSLLYDGGKRFYYMGPMFRHERPQRGRYRQFDQIGAEALGFSGPDVDAELILLAESLWREIGLKDIRLEINSLGEPDERAAHRQALIDYFEKNSEVLDDEAKSRLYSNPLRILDSKNSLMHDMLAKAPRPMDYLGNTSLDHFSKFESILKANGVTYVVNPRLVRGMDYYNRTVFEFITDRLGSQGTVCAGGRYDYLVTQLGGKAAPAVGWALGVSRVLELVKDQGLNIHQTNLDAYAVVAEESFLPTVLKVLRILRNLGVSVQMHTSNTEGMQSIKTQIKKADSSGANFALIFGEEEIAGNQVTVKSLRDAEGYQRKESLSNIETWGSALQLRP